MISLLWQERLGAGTVFGTGLVLVAEGIRLPTGHLASFGPGLFPLIIGIIICGLAIGIFATSGQAQSVEAGDGFAWRPMLFVGAGMLAFAEMIRPFGLVPATLALVLLASFSEPRIRPVTTVLVAAGLSVAGVAIFIWGLGLVIAPWRF